MSNKYQRRGNNGVRLMTKHKAGANNNGYERVTQASRSLHKIATYLSLSHRTDIPESIFSLDTSFADADRL